MTLEGATEAFDVDATGGHRRPPAGGVQMTRVVLVAVVLATVIGSGAAFAQTAAPDRGYAEFTFGPTFGHKTSGSIG